VGFLGAAQIDRFGNINTTVIGDYHRPKVRLPGAGGAPEIASCSGEVFVIVRQSRRTFVERLDFVTTVGHRQGGAKGVTRVVTDLGILEREEGARELVVRHLHPGVTADEVREATGWSLRIAPRITETDAPTADELATLRDLQERTRRAHAVRRSR